MKGDTGKQALKHICQRFFNFQPIFLKLSANASFFWGGLNRAIRSDLTLLHSAHFALHSAHFAQKKNQISTLKNKKVGKPVQNVRCAVQNVHCVHPVCQKIVCKIVYEIETQSSTAKISSLLWKTKKVWKTVKHVRCAVQNVHCAVVLDHIWPGHSKGLEKRCLCWKFQKNKEISPYMERKMLQRLRETWTCTQVCQEVHFLFL